MNPMIAIDFHTFHTRVTNSGPSKARSITRFVPVVLPVETNGMITINTVDKLTCLCGGLFSRSAFPFATFVMALDFFFLWKNPTLQQDKSIWNELE